MTLQQLRYMIQVSQSPSIRAAAEALFISQPSLSKAIADLEQEMGVQMFVRDNRGITLSEEGTKFLAHARQVVEQADLLEHTYKQDGPVRRVFAISAQHYAFVVNAFVALVREYTQNEYEFTLREARTHDILEDVRTGRSEIGIIYQSRFNGAVLERMLRDSQLDFIPLFTAKPHVFVSRSNPLAQRDRVTLEDLQPYPCLTYEQGIYNSFYFSEELHSTVHHPKSIVVTDRATLFNLVIGLDGYTISSGILSRDLNGDQIVSIPLDSDEYMRIGYLHPRHRPLSAISLRYLDLLREYIATY